MMSEAKPLPQFCSANNANALVMNLTLRQQQILNLIATELTTSEIARQLGISVPTVETHRRNLFRKAGVKSAAGLIKEAMRQGIIY